jgi:hypothetical protein
MLSSSLFPQPKKPLGDKPRAAAGFRLYNLP